MNDSDSSSVSAGADSSDSGSVSGSNSVSTTTDGSDSGSVSLVASVSDSISVSVDADDPDSGSVSTANVVSDSVQTHFRSPLTAVNSDSVSIPVPSSGLFCNGNRTQHIPVLSALLIRYFINTVVCSGYIINDVIRNILDDIPFSFIANAPEVLIFIKLPRIKRMIIVVPVTILPCFGRPSASVSGCCTYSVSGFVSVCPVVFSVCSTCAADASCCMRFSVSTGCTNADFLLAAR